MNNSFVIITDSCCDLNKEIRKKYNIQYIPMHFSYDEKEFEADLDWKEISQKEFYNLMREGKRITTAQITAIEYKKAFQSYIKQGYDILSISCSSALSNSVNASYMVRDELRSENAQSKILCVDSLNSCFGLGMMCIIASQMRAEGKSIEEVYSYLEENKLKFNQEATVESLKYLKQAGRVSAVSAFFGGLLNIKPIIISDTKGQNLAVEKIKGRKTSFERIAERVKEEFDKNCDKRIFIGHGDCIDDCQELKEIILNKLADKEIEIFIDYIGPIIGASCGPGVIGVYFMGKEVQI